MFLKKLQIFKYFEKPFCLGTSLTFRAHKVEIPQLLLSKNQVCTACIVFEKLRF